MPYIKQMVRVKQALIQTSRQIHTAIEKAEKASEDLQHKTNEASEKNVVMKNRLKEIMKEQDLLDTQFNRVLQVILDD